MWRFSLCLHVVLLRCPANVLGDSAPSSLADRCHSLRSLDPPPAALPSLPTGLSRLRDDNTWYNSNFLHSSQEKHVQEVLLCSSGEGEGPPLCKVSSQDSLIFE